MQWPEVRRIYPDSYVLLEDIKSRVENGERYIEEVAIIRPLADGNVAVREMRGCKGNKFIYHTSKDEIVIPIHPMPNLRGCVQ